MGNESFRTAQSGPGTDRDRMSFRLKGTAQSNQLKNLSLRRKVLWSLAAVGFASVVLGGSGWWLSSKAHEIRGELESARTLANKFKTELLSQDDAGAAATLAGMAVHTQAARSSAEDPLWKLAGAVPGVGPNLTAISEVAFSADDIVDGTAQPLLSVIKSLDAETLKPIGGRLDLEPIEKTSPSIVAAAHTLEQSNARLKALDVDNLYPPVSSALQGLTNELNSLEDDLMAAANVSRVLPKMMGASETRNYLVLIQNNAEVRATGGLPGALAVLTVENGSLRLSDQSSGSAMGKFSPPVPVAQEQVDIFTSRLGVYISDVNLTPDFPTAAKSAKAMWEARRTTHIDGVIALDPVVLSHLLDATGPVPLPSDPFGSDKSGMPRELTAENVVKVLLSDVYSQFESNTAQDAYFSRVTQEVFAGLTSGKAPAKDLLNALGDSAEENRLFIWSSRNEEQVVLKDTSLGGSTSGPAVGGANFGVYFNDGTGAKMDFHVTRKVQLTKECTKDSYDRVKVRVTMRNAAPVDAASALPKSVTGGGLYGVAPGSVQTNVIAYGPAQAQIETVYQDSKKTPFGSHLDAGRPVGVLGLRLEPGQSTTVEFTFGKIVQNEEPTLLVTPTVQAKEDVVESTLLSNCA